MKLFVVLLLVAVSAACSDPAPRAFDSLAMVVDGTRNGPWAGPLVDPVTREPYTGSIFGGPQVAPPGTPHPADRHEFNGGPDGISFGGRAGLCVGGTDPYGAPDPCPVRFQTRLGNLPEDTPSFEPIWSATLVEGRLQGVLEVWAPDSTPLARISYTAGRDEGPAVFFHLSGVMERRGEFADGAHAGTWEFFHLNGQLEERLTQVDHLPVGPWVSYYEDGTVRGSGTYEPPGEQSGTWEYFYPSGQLRQRSNHVGGSAEGSWELYHENGQLQERGSFVSGYEHGLWQVFDEAGTLELEGYMHRGSRCGPWLVDGQLTDYAPCPTQ